MHCVEPAQPLPFRSPLPRGVALEPELKLELELNSSRPPPPPPLPAPCKGGPPPVAVALAPAAAAASECSGASSNKLAQQTVHSWQSDDHQTLALDDELCRKPAAERRARSQQRASEREQPGTVVMELHNRGVGSARRRLCTV